MWKVKWMWTRQYYWSVHILSDSNNIRGSRHTGSVRKHPQFLSFCYPDSTAIKQSDDVQREPFPVSPSQQVRRIRQTTSVGMYYPLNLTSCTITKGVPLSYRFRISWLQPNNEFQWISNKSVPDFHLLLLSLYDVFVFVNVCVSW
jgi:hypothetical protein